MMMASGAPFNAGALLGARSADGGLLARPTAVQSPGIASAGAYPIPSARVFGTMPLLPSPFATSYSDQTAESQVRGDDRLAQALAELALEPEADQYPIDIVLVPGTSITLRDLALRRLEAVLPTPVMLPEQRVDPHYLGLLARLRPIPGTRPLGLPPGVEANALPRYAIEPAAAGDADRPHQTPFQVVDIVRAISSGTAQGTVYDVQVMLPRTGRNGVDLARAATAAAAGFDALGDTAGKHAALVRRGPDGPVTAVHAALKKSPIYSVGTWLARAALLRLVALRRRADGAGDRTWWRTAFVPGGSRAMQRRMDRQENAQLADWFARASAAVTAAGGPYLDPALVSAPVRVIEGFVRQLDHTLEVEFDNANNDAYVDAVGAFLGSQLAESGVSPFFGLLYATLRAGDSAFFDPRGEAATAIGPEINDGFPVQATIMQFLDGTLGSLIKDGFFAAVPGGQPTRPLDYRKAMALAAQVVFGLAAAQAGYGIVHNDFHNDNIAYENVPDDAVLYYRAEPSDGTDGPSAGGRYYAVPTFGKVYKMIDFGRATFRLGDEMQGADATTRSRAARTAPLWGSPTQDAVVEGDWNLRGFNNDLLRFVTVFLYNVDARADATPSGPADPWREAFMRMARHVTSCAPPGTSPAVAAGENPLSWMDRCGVLPGDPASRRRCADRALSVRPYLIGSPCVNAVPADNVHWFDDAFGIDPSEIPAGANVYSIPL
ncbi:hypothetical protein pneo_cds_350 [Pandoravirus neocaledonia]|uniref:Protein kinase domain-containing protein n=1 Tax=Pandoravirus neocaledonia TaxID=2107708 RepID=A0A2U7UBX0_9VIRU|nr:hypothetical protein pneo_cds_350 [Pandoravirus neocaledonia]AVK75957.1 hypothetical protein pneo_cds_350 [Pandoravirus neocaledonia]